MTPQRLLDTDSLKPNTWYYLYVLDKDGLEYWSPKPPKEYGFILGKGPHQCGMIYKGPIARTGDQNSTDPVEFTNGYWRLPSWKDNPPSFGEIDFGVKK